MAEEEKTAITEGATEEQEPTPVASTEDKEATPAEKPSEEEKPAASDETPKDEGEPPKEEEPREPTPKEEEPPQEQEETPQPKEEEEQQPQVEDQPQVEEQPQMEEQPPAEEQPQEPAEPESAKAPERPPRTKYFSLQPDDPVELLIGESGITAEEPISVGAFFKEAVRNYPDTTALAYKGEDGEWVKLTYTQYYDMCVRAAKSFLKLELEPFHSVAILGFNSVEWFVSAVGAILAGGVNVGIYTTNKPDVCRFIAEDSKADIIVAEDEKQLQKILSVKEELPNVKAFVQYRGKVTGNDPNVYEWEKFMELGSSIDNKVIEDKIAQLNPGHCASIIYTSGTTGYPKGVMLSHDSITWMCKTLRKRYTFIKTGVERVVSYLPLSHIAAQFLDIYLMMYMGGASYFAQPDALKGSLGTTLNEVHPTIFVGVPRVWEKIMDRIKSLAPPPGSLKSKISGWAKGIGLEGNKNIQKNASVPWGWTVAGMLVFKKVRERLGFSETKMFITTAAPIRQQVMDFFMSLNIPLLEIYGMSEGCGAVTVNIIEHDGWQAGSAGKPLEGIEMMLHDQNDKGEGELCFRGRNVMMGYYKNEEKTKEALDSDGWLHSGDLGVVDKRGFYTVTGRKKELIITSGGENVAPVPIEDTIKEELPFISNAMLVGDHRNYITCLLTLKCEMDPETGGPTDNLTADAARLIAAKGSTATKVSQVVGNEDPAVFTAIQEGIDRANAKAVSNAATVKKWTILGNDFSVEGGELGPTQKVRRFSVVNKYAETIEGLYTPQQ